MPEFCEHHDESKQLAGKQTVLSVRKNSNGFAGRLAVVTEIISPYRIPVFNQIAEELGDRLKVLFMAESEAKRQWTVSLSRIRFRYEVLKGKQFRQMGAIDMTYSWNPSVFMRLRAFDPDVIIIGGYHHPTSYAVLLYAKLTGTRIVLWCESHEADRRSGSRWREMIKRAFIKSCDGFLVPGTASRKYLIGYSVDESKIILAPNCTDTDVFFATDEQARQCLQRDTLKGNNLTSEMPDFILLFVGRLAPEKGFPVLVEILSTLQEERVDAGLLVVGDGPMRREYESMVGMRGLAHVVFVGFLEPKHIRDYYRLADVLIMPSISEPWGMVVNEAMALGLPVLCSPHVGAAKDMVVEDETGYVCSDVKCYVERLISLIKDPRKRDRMGQECLKMAACYSPQACASGFITALKRFRR